MRWLLAVSTLLLSSASVPAQDRVTLASAGQAHWPVVVAADATPAVKRTAETLAAYLGKISGARFAVATGAADSGIALVLGPADAKDPTKREQYRLRSHARGLRLEGASELALEHAVWDVLYRLGHRQFFPGATWEVIPRRDNLELAVDVRERPAYWSRSIWYGYGAWDYNADAYRDWNARNRMARGIELNTGHAYDGIRHRHEKVFAEHPEYLGLWQGQRQSTQFCISNPGLRRLVVNDALKQFAAKPALQSVSLEPADGSAWCQCEECKKLGSVSDRALTLANEVASALTGKLADRFVGLYAYNEHSPPPGIRAQPRVIVSVATAFVRGGYTVDQLLAGWQKQGATLGVREYYSVNTWDRDLPGAARGGNLAYLRRTIPHFHQLGARFMSAEASDNWGPNGLGYYVASRLLWNVADKDNVDAIVDDFLDKAFGSAREPMRKFYQLIDGAHRPLLCDDLLGRMYRLLDEAKRETSDPLVHARLDDLVLYTRYTELYSDYSTATGAARQAAFESLIKHAYRMRKTMMVHTKGLYRDLDNRDKSVTIPAEARWSVPEPKNPWKSSAPFASGELDALLRDGIRARALLDFQPVAFGDKLVPAAPLQLPEVKTGSMGIYYRGTNQFLTWLDRPGPIKLQTKAGVIYKNNGPGQFALYPAAEPEGKAVAQGQTLPDGAVHELQLDSTYPGLQRLEGAGGGGIHVTFPPETPVTVQSSPENPFHFHGRWTMYFYVPKGTKIVGGFSAGPGKLRDSAGSEVKVFDNKPNYFSIPVPPGRDGSLWKFENCAGVRTLMTVPPYLARSGRDLLLPEEVVQKDQRR
jgi:hypothetical protein